VELLTQKGRRLPDDAFEWRKPEPHHPLPGAESLDHRPRHESLARARWRFDEEVAIVVDRRSPACLVIACRIQLIAGREEEIDAALDREFLKTSEGFGAHSTAYFPSPKRRARFSGMASCWTWRAGRCWRSVSGCHE